MKLSYKKSVILFVFIFIFIIPILFTSFNSSQNNLTTERDDLDLKSSGSYVTFYLVAENGIELDTSEFWLWIDSAGNRKDFGVPVLVDTSKDVEIWVGEFKFYFIIFHKKVDLAGVSEYNITCNIVKLTINLNAREIGHFILTRFNGRSISFSMLPNTTKEIILYEGQYSATWLNTEDDSMHEYNFSMYSNREITLDSIFYDIIFTLSDQFLNELNTSLYSLYIDGTNISFGVSIKLDKENVLITVYDRFNITGFNSIVNLEGLSTYNVIVSIYNLKIQHLSREIGRLSLKEVITGNTHNFSMNPDTSRIFKLTNGNYEVSWLNRENFQIYVYEINLDSDYDLILKSIYYDIYFSIFTFDGIGLDHDLVRFYLNGIRSDFGNIELNTEYNDLLILDFFDNVLYNETVDLSDKTEWNIYVEMYNIEIKNAYNYAIDLVFERNGFTVEITVPAQFSVEYRFILNVEYNITWYKSSDGSYLGSMEKIFTKENLILSFGIPIDILPELNKPNKPNITLILIISIISIVSILGVFLYRKRLILYIRKRFGKLGDMNE